MQPLQYRLFTTERPKVPTRRAACRCWCGCGETTPDGSPCDRCFLNHAQDDKSKQRPWWDR